MKKMITVFSVLFVSLLIFSFCTNTKLNTFRSRSDSSKESEENISKEQVINLIKTQGTEENYYFEELFYQLVNADDDEELEIVARIDGAVHLGNFFVFDKGSEGKYSLAAERNWKVERLNIAEQGDLLNVIKFNEIVERTGGSGMDVYLVHLWYLKDGKFIEAWKETLKEESAFQGDVFFKVGEYQYVESIGKLFSWSSEYLFRTDTSTSIRKPSTTLSIHKFDGVKFIIESEEKYEHDKLIPEIKFAN